MAEDASVGGQWVQLVAMPRPLEAAVRAEGLDAEVLAVAHVDDVLGRVLLVRAVGEGDVVSKGLNSSSCMRKLGVFLRVLRYGCAGLCQ